MDSHPPGRRDQQVVGARISYKREDHVGLEHSISVWNTGGTRSRSQGAPEAAMKHQAHGAPSGFRSFCSQS